MPLHRDIHWLGRQWAVTGHGLQLINQKQMGYYDIEIARLWEPGVVEAMQSKAWINRDDFDKAVEIARNRFVDVAPGGMPPPQVTPAPPARAVPPPRPAIEPSSVPTIEELLARLKSRSAAAASAARSVEAPIAAPLESEAPKPELAEPEPPQAAPVIPDPPAPAVPPAPAAVAVRAADPPLSGRPKSAWPVFTRKIAGSGRFVRPWRASLTRWHRNLPGLPPRP
ncbi:hypothetical protein IC762_19260 [Bradyrhizobium genosp. L]|uniref:hypothetical protein n=1 Tax=Bradyrhizobium genosp. L TaxID=83637 RepID=UPI0018A2719D|nr:hypothetical protein [Bradyrhizobium genosp. L]QPF81936.1 hypothetical protein IC762_19260 [Bradyrhizobium genosp. L]